ncbi:MAG: response regulator transcription factor [Ruminococcus sp.]|nr:response regulator transcription factor [Ruminococcus sp.]
MFQILIVEDDASLRKLMHAALKQNGYEPYTAEDGEKALDLLEKTNIDLVISDIMMPNMDGYELTEQLRRANYNFPILLVTAKETFEDKQRGFNAGVDDYMVKPIDVNEMILRVGALLRRSKMASEHSLTVGSCTLDYDAQSVSVNSGKAETIPQKEFMLLFKLLSYPNKIFTRRQLLDELWGMESEVDERTVDVHIKRLRERYNGNGSFDIVTVRGLGYKAVKLV